MKIGLGMVGGFSKWAIATVGLGLVLASTGASANVLTLDFDNGKGTLTPTCSSSASVASCNVNPSDPGSTWSDASGFQTSTLKAHGKGSIGGSGTTLNDRIKLTHDYDGNGRRDPAATNKITETFKTLTYTNDILSVTNKASITGDEGLFSYTTEVEINPAGGFPLDYGRRLYNRRHGPRRSCHVSRIGSHRWREIRHPYRDHRRLRLQRHKLSRGVQLGV